MLTRSYSLLILSLLGSCASPEPVPADLAIVGATVIDGTGGPALTDRTLLVRDGAIVAIAPRGELPEPQARTVIDATGEWVVPGFIDVHTHLGLGGLQRRRPDATDRAIHQFLRYGVTGILVVGGTGGNQNDINTIYARQRKGELPPLRVLATGELLTVPDSHPTSTIMQVPEGQDPATYDWSQRGVAVVASLDAARAAVRRNLDAGMTAIKIIVESGPDAFGKHPRMQRDMIEAVVDEARSRGSFVVAHATSLDELEDCIAGGVRAVMHAISEPPLPGPRHWAEMRDRGIFYVPTLSLYGSLTSAMWSDERTWQDPFLTEGVDKSVRESVREFGGRTGWRDILASVGAAHRAGVRLALGTDTNNPRVFPGYSVHRELASLVEAGLTPDEALVTATRRPAELLRREDTLGTVQVGKRADLVVLGADPLLDIRNTREIRVVIAGGTVLRGPDR